ncbi:MAG: hypothetical protein K5647_07325 [Clostridiales bacterium]|nr:hypothetical protein [Clostridiales bacterium]
MDAESYLDGIAEKETDPDISQLLIERSGYDTFLETLNNFVETKSLFSKLTTALYRIDNQLEKAIESLQPKSIDHDINAVESSYLQQKHLLTESRTRLRQEVKDIFTTAASEVRNLGLNAANSLVDGCKQEEVEDGWEDAIRQANQIIERCQSDAAHVIEERNGISTPIACKVCCVYATPPFIPIHIIPNQQINDRVHFEHKTA